MGKDDRPGDGAFVASHDRISSFWEKIEGKICERKEKERVWKNDKTRIKPRKKRRWRGEEENRKKGTRELEPCREGAVAS